MTIFYLDLSSFDAGFQIPAGSVAVVAKCTEGTYYVDKSYADFKNQAAKVGAAFSGYHFLISYLSPEAQAQYYWDHCGEAPCMLDVETTTNSKPGVDWCLRFIAALKALGGRVWGVYYPQWYWQQTGGNLGLLEAAGAVIISSYYSSTYSDTGAGWKPYGGAKTITVWQFKSSPHDTDAFKGTPAELAALITGDNMTPADVWGFENSNLDKIDMRQYLVNAANNTAAILAALNTLTATVNGLKAGSVDPVAVADAELAEIKAKL